MKAGFVGDDLGLDFLSNEMRRGKEYIDAQAKEEAEITARDYRRQVDYLTRYLVGSTLPIQQAGIRTFARKQTDKAMKLIDDLEATQWAIYQYTYKIQRGVAGLRRNSYRTRRKKMRMGIRNPVPLVSTGEFLGNIQVWVERKGNTYKAMVGVPANAYHSSGIKMTTLAKMLEYGTRRMPAFNLWSRAYRNVVRSLGRRSLRDPKNVYFPVIKKHI